MCIWCWIRHLCFSSNSAVERLNILVAVGDRAASMALGNLFHSHVDRGGPRFSVTPKVHFTKSEMNF